VVINRAWAARASFCLFSAVSVASAAAATASDDGALKPEDLEQVTVYAPGTEGTPLGGATITQTDIRTFNRDALDTALVLASGVSVSSVGARNETDVWIRGFDRWRVPLYQDGIPIYLPVDDRIDFGRFSTLDLAEIQVSKGFASVIDGPGAMGGSINLVSRVAKEPLDGDARVGVTLDSRGDYQGWQSDMFVGTRQGNWFAQAAGSFTKDDDFRLSDDYSGGTIQGPGERLQSQHKDYKINLKAGIAPDFGGEYAINFIDQVGVKGNPPQDGIIPKASLSQARYWTWPSWDKKSVYLLGRIDLDDRGSYIKTRAYYDKFYNQLDSYDSIAYDTQNTPKSFNSTYDDRAAGAIVELDENLPGNFDTLRASGNFRWDQHNETESTRNAPAPVGPFYQQPWETAEETTSSLALENIYHPITAMDVTAGVSYDYRRLIGDSQWVAQGTTPPFGYSFAYPTADKHATNYEAAVVYRYSNSGSVHASYADRWRFPTLFEMYSTRFGTFVNNPDLQPERSHYFQVGVSDNFIGTTLVANVFYARVVDGIVTQAINVTTSESVNGGVEKRYGYELEASRQLLESLKVGANFASLKRVVISGAVEPTDTPDHKLFAFTEWHPIAPLALVASVDIEDKRWLQSAVNSLLYYQGGSFTLLNAKGSYNFTSQASAELGVNNLTDRNYVIEDGYHAPGRTYFANVRVNF
jgi:iron complex outermembrane recepter protein